MKVLQDCVFAKGFNPVDSTGATTNGPAFDTAGYNHVAFIGSIGNIAANASAFKIQESADGSTGWADITSYGFTSPTAAGSDNTLYGAFLQCGGGRLRYFRATITGGAGATLISGVWIGAGANQSPSSATERGVAEQLMPTT